MTQQPAIDLAPGDLNRQGGIACPHPKSGMPAWNSHPRVYLDLSHTGQARCPYCGTQYRLQDTAGHGGGHS